MARTRTSSAPRRWIVAAVTVATPLVAALTAHAGEDPTGDDATAASSASASSAGPAASAEAEKPDAIAPPPPAPTSTGPVRATWHPKYAVELEGHASLASFDDYFVGFGGGARATIPIWDHTPFARIDDEIDFSAGFDIVYYPGYQPNPGALSPATVRLTTYYFPVSIDWSVWIGTRTNFFIGPAMVYRFGSYQDRCPQDATCLDPNKFLPSGELGFRFRIADHVAFTARVTWPMLNLGASWL